MHMFSDTILRVRMRFDPKAALLQKGCRHTAPFVSLAGGFGTENKTLRKVFQFRTIQFFHTALVDRF